MKLLMKLSRLDIVFLCIAGIWAVLVFAEAPIVYNLRFARNLSSTSNIIKALFGGWIPCALVWLLIRFCKR